MDELPQSAPVRIARPSRDIVRAERFWTEGAGLTVLYRSGEDVTGGHPLVMVGIPGASWHVELVDDPETARAHPPGPEDLFVLYLGEEPSEGLIDRILAAGGRRTEARNPYWNAWGVTLTDPDGYQLVLCRRSWTNA